VASPPIVEDSTVGQGHSSDEIRPDAGSGSSTTASLSPLTTMLIELENFKGRADRRQSVLRQLGELQESTAATFLTNFGHVSLNDLVARAESRRVS